MYDDQKNANNIYHAFVEHFIYTTKCIRWLFTLATHTMDH